MSKAWADHVNAKGGIAGHPVEIVFDDTRGDPAASTAAARKFIDDESVSAVFSVDIAGEAAFGPTLSKAGLPLVGGFGVNPTVWGALPHVYSVITSFPPIVASMPIAARNLGVHAMAVGLCGEVAACRASDQILRNYAAGVGVNVATIVELHAASVDYNAECLQLIKSHAEFIQISTTNAVGQRLASDCMAQGYHGWFGATATTLNADIYGQKGMRISGGISGFPWFVDAAPVKEFRAIMDGAGVSSAKYGNMTATSVYATLELFRTAVAANRTLLDDGKLSRQDVIDAYATVKNEDLGGLVSMPLTFDKSGISPKNPCFWVIKADNGNLSGDFKPICLKDYGLEG